MQEIICPCCGAIVPADKKVCPNCLVTVRKEDK